MGYSAFNAHVLQLTGTYVRTYYVQRAHPMHQPVEATVHLSVRSCESRMDRDGEGEGESDISRREEV